MRICISAEGKTSDSNVDQRFGRCKYFMFIDIDSMKFEIVENNNINNSEGAGVKAGQLVVSKEIGALLTGNIGPNACQIVNSASIEIYTGIKGKISDVVKDFQSGKFKKTSLPNVDSKAGR